MRAIGGWEYWIEHDGHVRQIMVAEPQDLPARALIQDRFQVSKFLAKKAIPEEVTRMLNLQSGCFTEAFTAKRDGEPDPKFGFPMDMDYASQSN
jgi:hypothetical protein